MVPAESQALCPKPSISRGKSRAKRPLQRGTQIKGLQCLGAGIPDRSRGRHGPGTLPGNTLRNTVCLKPQAQGLQAFTLPKNTVHR